MKIVLVTPLLNHGGGQRYITALANYWSSIDHEVTIILLRSGQSFYPISEKVKIHRLGYCDKNKRIKFTSGVRTFFRLRKRIKNANPDFVISILSSTNILTLMATSFLGFKIFVRDAMSPFRKRSMIEQILRKLLYKNAAGIITMTKKAKEFIQNETGATNIKVIPNPVKTIWSGNSEKEKIVLNVGRLISAKGQEYFLKACAIIDRPDWKFVILGEGNLRDKLEKQIIELGIEKRVLMPGAIKNIDEWLSKSSIFVFSSVSEGFPNALLEGMAAGLPCVSFDCNVGPSDIIDDGRNGYLIPVRNVQLLAEKIALLMDNENLRILIAEKGKEDSKNFNIEVISEKLLDFCAN